MITKSERFEQFHEDNPYLYDALVLRAREWRQAGHDLLGMAALRERVRWDYGVESNRGIEEFKISNDFTPYYARLIMAQEGDLREIFKLRSAEADDWIEDYLERLAEL